MPSNVIDLIKRILGIGSPSMVLINARLADGFEEGLAEGLERNRRSYLSELLEELGLDGTVRACPGKMWDEIVHLREVIAREDAWLDAMGAKYSPPDHCCPSCACPGYAATCAKQDRRRAWLRVLEEKAARGGSTTWWNS